MNNQNINMQQVFQNIRNNQEMMQNQTVSNVMKMRENGDRSGLVDLYKNVCKTFGRKPDERLLNQ